MADWLLAAWLLTDWLLAAWLLVHWRLTDWLLVHWLLTAWLLADWLLTVWQFTGQPKNPLDAYFILILRNYLMLDKYELENQTG